MQYTKNGRNVQHHISVRVPQLLYYHSYFFQCHLQEWKKCTVTKIWIQNETFGGFLFLNLNFRHLSLWLCNLEYKTVLFLMMKQAKFMDIWEQAALIIKRREHNIKYSGHLRCCSNQEVRTSYFCIYLHEYVNFFMNTCVFNVWSACMNM